MSYEDNTPPGYNPYTDEPEEQFDDEIVEDEEDPGLLESLNKFAFGDDENE